MNIGRKRRRSGGEESSLLDLFQAGDQYYLLDLLFFLNKIKFAKNLCIECQHRISGWIIGIIGESKGLSGLLKLGFYSCYQG